MDYAAHGISLIIYITNHYFSVLKTTNATIVYTVYTDRHDEMYDPCSSSFAKIGIAYAVGRIIKTFSTLT